MKNIRKRIIGLTLALGVIGGIGAIPAHAEWKQDNIGWWYSNENSYATGWKQIDGNWYYFDNDGYMKSGQYVGNYYLNNKGIWTNLDHSLINDKYNEFLQDLNTIEKNDSTKLLKIATTYDYMDYSKNFNQQYDTLLNDIYNYLKENMNQTEFTKLQNEEVKWVSEKEAAIKKSEDIVIGGSMHSYIGELTSLHYTHDRIYELFKFIKK